ncbi:MAG: TonB-dependent receptor [Bacteroidales bacterium]
MNLSYKFKMPVYLFFWLFFLFLNYPDRAVGSNMENKESVTVADIFAHIEQTSPYVIFYNSSLVDLEQQFKIDMKDKNIFDILDCLFNNTGLKYRVIDKQIIIFRNTNSPEVKKEESLGSVSGRVRDKMGEELIGVNVRIKGTTIGTVTGIDGRFNILVPDKESQLEASYVGFFPQVHLLKDASFLDIVLEENTEKLNEVVVIGYGSQSRVSITGAVSTISGMDLSKSPVSNISTSLTGQLTGLMATQRRGEPGADESTLWIRGLGTYMEDALSPLVMVDGVERSLNDLDSEEIDNISILKDASSTAIYGGRGANGVLLVTTKRGEIGKAIVNASYQYSLQLPTRLPEYLDSYDVLKLYREGLINDGRESEARQLTEQYLCKFRDRSSPANTYLYPNVNWMNELLNKTAQMMKANINVKGGSANTRYFVSLGYLGQEGLYKEFPSEVDYRTQPRVSRYNFRANIDMDLFRDLSLLLNIGGFFRNRNYPGTSGDTFFKSLKTNSPYRYPMVNPDGSVAGIERELTNPYGLLTQTGYKSFFDTNIQTTLVLNLNLSWLLRGLKVGGRISFDIDHFRNVSRLKKPYIYQFVIDEKETDMQKGDYLEIQKGDDKLSYEVSSNGARKFGGEFFLEYNHKFFVDHELSLFALYTQGNQILGVPSGSKNLIQGLPHRTQGIVGRANYAYKRKYYLETNFGYNGSENFPKGNRFGFFPSLSAAWIMSEESFLKDRFTGLTLWKLRSSVGLVGNDYIGNNNRFIYMDNWNMNSGDYYFDENFAGNKYESAIQLIKGNKSVTWEKARKINIGMDMVLWNNLFSIEADLFFEKRWDILTLSGRIPEFSGIINMPLINAGSVRNKGFEIQVGHTMRIGNHQYSVLGNVSFARNKILEKDEPPMPGLEYQQSAGRRIGEQKGLVALGLFKDWDEINDPDTPVHTFCKVQPGDIRYKDMNEDGKIDAKDITYLNRVYRPEGIFGFSLGYKYRNFETTCRFQGAMGGHYWFTGDTVFPFQSKSGSVLKMVKDNHYGLSNPDSEAEWPRLSANDNVNNYRNSTFWLREKKYLRLKNIEIAYSVPGKFLQRFHLDGMRLFVTGWNLFTWDNLKIVDPETTEGTGYYPQLQIYNVGFNLTF